MKIGLICFSTALIFVGLSASSSVYGQQASNNSLSKGKQPYPLTLLFKPAESSVSDQPSVASSPTCGYAAVSDSEAKLPPAKAVPAEVKIQDDQIQQTQGTQIGSGVQRPNPIDISDPSGGNSSGTSLVSLSKAIETISKQNFATEPSGSAPPAASTTGGGSQAEAKGISNLGQMLQQSGTTTTVETQRRNPTSFDPNIRGYKQGQIYTSANGAYWLAARQDLDTMLGKIDPSMVNNVNIISGPYGLQNGPGLSFITIDTFGTPRYENGPETHVRVQGMTRTNGGNVYGRTTLEGGDAQNGYRLSYGQQEGDNYLAGNDLSIPASYENRDVWAQYGYDFNPEQHIEFKYLRLEQTDVEYPAQFFNIDDSITDGFEMRIVDEMGISPWDRLTIDVWYNRTRFNGDNIDKRRPDFPEIQRLESAVDTVLGLPFPTTRITAFTDGDLLSTGTRGAMFFGDRKDRFSNVGVDFRYIEQNIGEQFYVNTLFDPFAPPGPEISTNMPRSWVADPGAFFEYGIHPTDDWLIQAGARVDLYNTTADAATLRPGSTISLPGGIGDLDQEDVLFATYLSNEFTLSDEWTAVASAGAAERAPTLIERYADGLFLGVAQSGFTRVIGDPNLDKETDFQVDLGLRANYENWRVRGDIFHAWIKDYITLNGDIVSIPELQSARLFRYQNTSLATLAGFEVSGEFDWSDMLSPFGTMRFVEGRDQEIDAPLPSIAPLDSTIGVRFHEPSQERKWEIEFAARIVDNQDRLGTTRLSGGPAPIEEATPGFTVFNLRGNYSYSRNLQFVAGVENLFDRNYQEHLSLRLIGPAGFVPDATRVLSPGITPYFGIDWKF